MNSFPEDASTTALELATICLVNKERISRGLVGLRPNTRLALAARQHSADMVARQYFDHVSPEGDDVSDRLFRTRYLNKRVKWTVGENIAWGSAELGSPTGIVAAWMKSPGHRRNILNPKYREIGLGVVAGGPVPLEEPTDPQPPIEVPDLPILPGLPIDDVIPGGEEVIEVEAPAATYTNTFGVTSKPPRKRGSKSSRRPR